MGLLRALNPLTANVTAPRHRTARAAERMQRDIAAALAEASANAAAPAAHPYLAAGPADRTQLAAAAIGAMIARGEHVPAADLELLRRQLAEVQA